MQISPIFVVVKLAFCLLTIYKSLLIQTTFSFYIDVPLQVHTLTPLFIQITCIFLCGGGTVLAQTLTYNFLYYRWPSFFFWGDCPTSSHIYLLLFIHKNYYLKFLWNDSFTSWHIYISLFMPITSIFIFSTDPHLHITPQA